MSNSYENKTLDAKILEVLKEENGFDANDLGTYFYKDVIKYIIFSLTSIREEAESEKEKLSSVDMSILNEIQKERTISKEDLYFLIESQREENEAKLKKLSESYHSEIYFIVAKSFNDTDLDTFHKHIKEATLKSKFVNGNPKYANLYLFLAYPFAECILKSIEKNLEESLPLLKEKLEKLKKEKKALQYDSFIGTAQERLARLTKIETEIESVASDIFNIEKRMKSKLQSEAGESPYSKKDINPRRHFKIKLHL